MMSAIVGNTIRVEQMLHGYSGGHRLLSSSCALSKTGQRHARMMSDLSGAAFKSGFDGYLTGYPLVEDSFYALGKTWFARELPRPGCVWTHTILIPFEELGRLEAFDELLSLHRQPNADDTKRYSEPLTIRSNGVPVKTAEPSDYIAHVIEAVYSHAEDIVVLPSKNAEEHEPLLVAIWRQQWPSLRCHFSFCTGALDLRVGEDRLDVQAIPDEKRLIQKASNKAKVVELKGSSASERPDAWIAIVTEDLIFDREKSLRAFLRSYGDIKHRSRSDFRRYCVCFSKLNEDSSMANVFSAIAQQFPDGSEARALKAAVVGAPDQRSYFVEERDESVLDTLFHSRAAAAFDFASLRVDDRIRKLWMEQEEEALSLLLRVSTNNDMGCLAFLADAVASIVTKESIARIATKQCEITKELVIRNQSLAEVCDVWKCKGIRINSFGDEFVQQLNFDKRFAKSVITALILANRQDCGQEVASQFGSDLADLLLGLNRTTLTKMDKQEPSIWKDVLRDSEHICLEWLRHSESASPEAAALATLGLRIETGLINGAVLRAWEKVSRKIAKVSSHTLRHAHATMLAACFDQAGDETAESVACICFPTIYEAAMQGLLSDDHWNMLERRLTESGMLWDRCKKLRMGLLNYCVRFDWSVDTFVRCTAVGSSFEEVLGSWGLDKAETTFLGQAIDSILSSDKTGTDSQKRSAERYDRWF